MDMKRTDKNMKLSSVISLAFALGLCVTGCDLDEKAQDSTPEVLISDGWKQLRIGEYNQAAALFRKAEKNAKDKDLREMAKYGSGIVCSLRQPTPDKKCAESIFREIVSESPKSDFASWSLLAIARQQHVLKVGEIPDYPAVRKAYQDVIDLNPMHPAAEEAFIFQQETSLVSLSEKDVKEALSNLENFIKERPSSLFISPAYLLTAKCHEILGNPKARIEALISALNALSGDKSNPDLDFAANYWEIATIAEFELGDFATARKYYTLFRKEYPSDIKNFGAKAAMERMDALELKLRKESSETALRKEEVSK